MKLMYDLPELDKAAESDAPQSYTVYLDEQEIGSVKTNSFIFENLSAGIHTLGVKSVYKVSESDIATTTLEVPATSDYADVKVKVSTNGGSSEGVAVNYLSGSYQVTDTIKSGISHFASLKKGEYMISINDDRFLAVDTLIDIDKDMEINLSISGDRYNQIGNISFCFFAKRGRYDEY